MWVPEDVSYADQEDSMVSFREKALSWVAAARGQFVINYVLIFCQHDIVHFTDDVLKPFFCLALQ